MDLALSLRSCLGGTGVCDDDDGNASDGEEDDEEDEGMKRQRKQEGKKGKELRGVTKHTGQTVLGVLLGAGEALVSDAETAIANRKTGTPTLRSQQTFTH